MTYFARPNQPLNVHLENVSKIAGSFAKTIDLFEEAVLAGSLHDLGKYRQEFQDYLRGDRASSQETQHAAYGAIWAMGENQLLQAFVIAGHHAGLHDMADLQGIPYKSVLGLPDALEISLRLYLAEFNPPIALPAPKFLDGAINPLDQALRIDFAVRMLFSCLVDADRLDSAFWPLMPPDDRPLDASGLLERVRDERQRKAGKSPESPLKSSRNQIFDTCLLKAGFAQGFFSLTVPTGGGKTLSAMAFALAHARKHNLRRVIVVIPYLSIIEQNAAEYRRILGNDVVLENHSSVKPRPDADEEERDALELAAENWDSPVVITTSVQFIESLHQPGPHHRCLPETEDPKLRGRIRA